MPITVQGAARPKLNLPPLRAIDGGKTVDAAELDRFTRAIAEWGVKVDQWNNDQDGTIDTLTTRIAQLEWNPPRGFQIAATLLGPSPIACPAATNTAVTSLITFTGVADRKYIIKYKMRAIISTGAAGDCNVAVFVDGALAADNHQNITPTGYASVFMEYPFTGDGLPHAYQGFVGPGPNASAFTDQPTCGLEIHDIGPVELI